MILKRLFLKSKKNKKIFLQHKIKLVRDSGYVTFSDVIV